MASQFLQPKGKHGEWLLQGPWGERRLKPMSKISLYGLLHIELIKQGVLPPDSPSPSNRYHAHVTTAIKRSSFIEGRWMPDESFAKRLKRLREQVALTQEELATKCDLDVGTIRQLEQGTRRNPTWQTVCALARGFDKQIVIFVGTA